MGKKRDPLASMSRKKKLELLIDLVETREKALEGAKHIFSEDVDKRAEGRESLDEIGREYGINIDYDKDDFNHVQAYSNFVRGISDKKLSGFTRDYVEEISRANSEGKLAKMALATPPTKIGVASHDDVVKIHERYTELAELITGYQQGRNGPERLVKKAGDYAERDTKEALSENADPINKYIGKDLREFGAKLARTLVSSDEKRALQTVATKLRKTEEKFNSKFSNNTERANYAVRNIVEYAHKGEEEAIEAAKIIYSIAKSK